MLCCKLAYANPGTVNSAVPVPVKSTGVQLILVLPQTEKSWKIWLTEYSSTRSGFHHACMICSAGLDLHACSYELASCLKGAAGSQICKSGAAMPDRLALLLATNRFASATVIMFALQRRTHTISRPPQTGVTEPFLVPLSDSLPVSKHPIILYVCWCLLIFVLINKIGRPYQNCSMSLLTCYWGTSFRSVQLK